MGRFFVAGAIGEHRHMTPEGFLICTGVPIARTGNYEYRAAEGQSPGITPSDDGTIISRRDPDEVFAPAALASFEGKPVTIGHPADMVTADDWRQYAVGHVQNVRRGEGDDADKVIADLVISDAAAIDRINGGLREISCGYDADLEQVEKGVERQTNIRGNHVAIVPAGRAGAQCAIRDEKGGTRMAENSMFSWEQVKDLLGIFKGKAEPAAAVVDTDPAAKDPAPAATTEPKADDELEQLKARIAELEAERDALKAELESNLETELIDADGDETAAEAAEGELKTDSLGFANRVQILAPTLYAAAFKSDNKAEDRKLKLDAMRRALDRACDDEAKRAVVWAVAGRKVDSWYGEKDSRVARVFNAASAAIAQINNAKVPAPAAHVDSAAAGGQSYLDQVMARYAEFAKGGKK